MFWGRGAAPALIPAMAGMARMPSPRTFLTWNAAGGVLCGAGCVLARYAFSAALGTLFRSLTWAPIAVIGVLPEGSCDVGAWRRRERAPLP